MELSRQELGKEAEKAALRFLESKGMLLLEQNYRCKLGEVDLIMRDGDTLAFVEVRCRSAADHGSALESITPNKMRKVVRTALHYLQKTQLLYKTTSRFDVVTLEPVDGQMKLDWIKNAFTVDRF